MAVKLRWSRRLTTFAFTIVFGSAAVLASASPASAHQRPPQPPSPPLGGGEPTHPVIVGVDFEPEAIPAGGTTRLSFSLTNTNLDLTATGIAFDDALPAGLVVAAAPVVRPGFCDVTVNAPPGGGVAGGTLTAHPGSGVISLSNLTLLPGQPCLFDVDVTTAPGASAGAYTNTIGPISTENTGPGLVISSPAVLTVSSSGSSVGGGEGSSPAWTPQASGVSQGLRAVTFVDADDGWAVGEDGVVLGTSDGGTTWTLLSHTTGKRLSGVSFVDRGKGWAVGVAGTILHTVSGGLSWSPQTPAGQFLTSVSFADDTHGWAVGASGTILATADAGKTWTRQPSGTTADLFGVSFSHLDGAYVGVAVGEGGTVLRTFDGGASWAPVPSGTTLTLRGVSVEGHWAWAVGDGGTIVHASVISDFAPQPSSTSANLSAISFVDEEHGIAVGDGGTVLGTSDGGQTWAQQDAGTSRNLAGVVLGDSARAWAVGDGGTILTSSSAGLGGANPGGTGPGHHHHHHPPNEDHHGPGHHHGPGYHGSHWPPGPSR